MNTMRQQRHRRLLGAAAAAALTLAYVQATSVPTSPDRTADVTWDSIVSEVRQDVSGTVAGIRRERAEHQAVLTRMRNDLRVLDDTLSPTTSANPFW